MNSQNKTTDNGSEIDVQPISQKLDNSKLSKNSPEHLEMLRLKRNEQSRLSKQKKRNAAKGIIIGSKPTVITDTTILNKSNTQLEVMAAEETKEQSAELDVLYEEFSTESNNRDLEAEFFNKTNMVFNVFYKNYYPKLYWYILKIVRDPDQAKDVVNVAFMQSLNKIDSYNPEYNFSTWLFNIAQKYAFTHLKEKAKFFSIDEKDEDGNTLLNYFESKIESKSVEDNQIIMTKYKYMIKQIDLLPEKYRRVIVMRELDNLSYEEINEALGIGLQNVKNQIRNGRIKLQGMVKEYFDKVDRSM